MSKKGGPSISDLLQESLNVMADELTVGGGEGGGASSKMSGPSASSLLINIYKDKLASKDEVVKVKAPEKKTNAFLNQLGDSIDQEGAEWKGSTLFISP